MVDKEGGVSMEDAAGFFANVFGGDRFNDYVSLFVHMHGDCSRTGGRYIDIEFSSCRLEKSPS